MLLSLLAATLTLGHQADTWPIKPTFDPTAAKQVWAALIDAEADGQAHHATFELTLTTKSVTDKKTVETFGWDKLKVDDQEGMEVPTWDAAVGPRGELLQMEGGVEDSYRRMLSELVFIYPEKPVAEGDKWSVEVKPTSKGEKITYDYEAKSKELVDGVNTLIVSVKVKEAGANPISGTGFWWLNKVGKVVKFEMKLDNWVVPIAGDDAVTNVVIRGKAK